MIGTRGNTHGDRTDSVPARKLRRKTLTRASAEVL
jgi:hypothetical protein